MPVAEFLPDDWRKSVNPVPFRSGILSAVLTELDLYLDGQPMWDTLEEAHSRIQAGLAQAAPIKDDDEHGNHRRHAHYWAEEIFMRAAKSKLAKLSAGSQIREAIQDLIFEGGPAFDGKGNISKAERNERFFDNCWVQVATSTWDIEESPEYPDTNLDPIYEVMTDSGGTISLYLIVEYPSNRCDHWPVWLSIPTVTEVNSNGNGFADAIVYQPSKRRFKVTATSRGILMIPITCFQSPEWLRSCDMNIDLTTFVEIPFNRVYGIVESARAWYMREFEAIRNTPLNPPSWSTTPPPEEKHIQRRKEPDPDLSGPKKERDISLGSKIACEPDSPKPTSADTLNESRNVPEKEDDIGLIEVMSWEKRDNNHKTTPLSYPEFKKRADRIQTDFIAKPEVQLPEEQISTDPLSPDSKDQFKIKASEIDISTDHMEPGLDVA